ncbi:MAG: TonB-dependent receptor, partial [Candidatus Thiodiazotropha sp.]
VTLSRKTRLPTIKDRYSYRFGTALPNPDLEAEKSTTLEFGWVHRFGHWARLESAVFYSDIRDLIESVDINSDVYQLQNVGKVSSKGVELGGDVWLGDGWEAGGNYTYLKQENKSSDLKLTNVPEHKAQAWLTWHVTDPLSFTADTHYESERYTSSDGSREADSFTVFGLRAGYEFAQGWVGRLGVSNLSDENYAYQEGYPEAGRTWYGNLSYQF